MTLNELIAQLQQQHASYVSLRKKMTLIRTQGYKKVQQALQYENLSARIHELEKIIHLLRNQSTELDKRKQKDRRRQPERRKADAS